jgi:hypothetical protein
MDVLLNHAGSKILLSKGCDKCTMGEIEAAMDRLGNGKMMEILLTYVEDQSLVSPYLICGWQTEI